MATLHLISGLPCSGKTTYAAALGADANAALFSLDRWLITAFHSSANAFDNPILEKARQLAMLQWGGIGTAAGALIGVLVGRAVGRRRRA